MYERTRTACVYGWFIFKCMQMAGLLAQAHKIYVCSIMYERTIDLKWMLWMVGHKQTMQDDDVVAAAV